MKTTLTLLLSLLLVSPTRGENDYMKGKIVPNFKVLNSDEVGLISGQVGRRSPGVS